MHAFTCGTCSVCVHVCDHTRASVKFNVIMFSHFCTSQKIEILAFYALASQPKKHFCAAKLFYHFRMSNKIDDICLAHFKSALCYLLYESSLEIIAVKIFDQFFFAITSTLPQNIKKCIISNEITDQKTAIHWRWVQFWIKCRANRFCCFWLYGSVNHIAIFLYVRA